MQASIGARVFLPMFKGGFNGQQPNFQHQIWALS